MSRRRVEVFGVLFLLGIFSSASAEAQSCHGGGAGGGGGATALVWTDPVLAVGVTPIKAVHVLEMRTHLNAKRAACGLAPTVWSESIIPNTTPIKKLHIDELRTSTNELIAQAAAGAALPTYTDATLVAGSTPIKAAHIQELRAAISAVPCGGGGVLPASSASFNADYLYQAPPMISGPIWNNYKAWLINQFSIMGTDISGYDFSAMSSHFNSVLADCRNTGDNGNQGVTQSFSVNGMTVNLAIKWEGNEWFAAPVSSRSIVGHRGLACHVRLTPKLVGTLNGFTCP